MRLYRSGANLLATASEVEGTKNISINIYMFHIKANVGGYLMGSVKLCLSLGNKFARIVLLVFDNK